MFHLLRDSRRDVGLLKIVDASAYFGHLITTWSIERFSLHASHAGTDSLEMRKEWSKIRMAFSGSIYNYYYIYYF